MSGTLLTRRTMLKTAALASTALAAPFVHGAYAAGKLAFGVWDHWVPKESEVLVKLCNEWAAKEKVEITVDLITSNGDKDLLTLMAEGQARAGHDIMGLRTWYVSAQADNFEPVDDVVLPLIEKYGKTGQACEYLGKINGHWMGVPTAYGSSALPPCARIDLFKQFVGLDVQKMYPVGPPDKELTDAWTWEYFLTAAEKCFKGGYPFGLPMSTCTDAINNNGVVFTAYGAQLVDVEGNITVRSDATRQVLEYFQRLVKFLPDSVWAYDNAGNNKALISGQAALIQNPPSAYAVAKRDAPDIAKQLWTFHSPKGPKGRFDPSKLSDFKIYEEEGPPKGTNYNMVPRGDVIASIVGYPAPLKIGTQMWAQATVPKMIAQCTQSGKSIEAAIDWAESELEGMLRS